MVQLQIQSLEYRVCSNAEISCSEVPSFNDSNSSSYDKSGIVREDAFDKLLPNKIQHFLKLIRKPRGFHHPLSHLLLIQYLFKSWNLFCTTYQWESQFQLDLSPQLHFENLILKNISDENLNEIAIRYKGGESIRKLALMYDYDIGTLMRKLGKLNLATIKRRPKKVSQEILDCVLDMLSHGHALKSISQKTNLSKSTIDRICASNSSIQQVWKQNKKVYLRKEKKEAVIKVKSVLFQLIAILQTDVLSAKLRP